MELKTEERKNRFNGESIMLTKKEAIIHDRIFINEMEATLEKTLESHAKILARFQMTEGDNNAK